jgi:hypothetical protein
MTATPGIRSVGELLSDRAKMARPGMVAIHAPINPIH